MRRIVRRRPTPRRTALPSDPIAQDEALDVLTADKEPWMLGEMDDLKHGSMRYHVARMLGMDDASPVGPE